MGVRTLLWRVCYEGLATRVREPGWSFMNYGYAALPDGTAPVPLSSEDEPDRFSIQLYEHTLAGVDLTGADVLEVGCGRGGGSSYLSRYHRTASTTGMDLSAAAVALCRRTRSGPGLTFVHGDALSMPFADSSFDVVVNVESSHCYDSMTRFLAEVHRVLRPGGRLLWADLRDGDRVRLVREALAAGPLELRRERDITAEVLLALELDDARRQALLRAWVPWSVRPALRRWAGLSGTTNVTRLRSGRMRYLSAALEKAA